MIKSFAKRFIPSILNPQSSILLSLHKPRLLLCSILLLSLTESCLGFSPDYWKNVWHTLSIRPVVGAGMGYGFAEDDAKTYVSVDPKKPLIEVHTDGAGAHGSIYKGDLGLNIIYGHLYTGARLSVQESCIHQFISMQFSTGGTIRLYGEMYNSTFLTGRVGYDFFDNRVIFFMLGGFVWSRAEDETYIDGAKTNETTLNQKGPLVGMGVAVNLTPHWIVELEYNYIDYQPATMPSEPDVIAQRTEVDSLNTSTLVSIVYQF